MDILASQDNLLPPENQQRDVLTQEGRSYQVSLGYLLENKAPEGRKKQSQIEIQEQVMRELDPLKDQLKQQQDDPFIMQRLNQVEEGLTQQAIVLNDHRGNEASVLLQGIVDLTGKDGVLTSEEVDKARSTINGLTQQGSIFYTEPTLGFPIVQVNDKAWEELRSAKIIKQNTQASHVRVLVNGKLVRFLLRRETLSYRVEIHETQHFVSGFSKLDREDISEGEYLGSVFKEEAQSFLAADQSFLSARPEGLAYVSRLVNGEFRSFLPEELKYPVQQTATVLELATLFAKTQGIPRETFLPLIMNMQGDILNQIQKAAIALLPEHMLLSAEGLQTVFESVRQPSALGLSPQQMYEILTIFRQNQKQFAAPEGVVRTFLIDDTRFNSITSLKEVMQRKVTYLEALGISVPYIQDVTIQLLKQQWDYGQLGIRDETARIILDAPDVITGAISFHSEDLAKFIYYFVNLSILSNYPQAFAGYAKILSSPDLRKTFLDNRQVIRDRWHDLLQKDVPQEQQNQIFQRFDELISVVEQQQGDDNA